MLGALQKHRDCLVDTAIRLFRRQGYAATGLAELLARSGAPKGSLYHYFPDGKEGVAEAAMRAAWKWTEATMKVLAVSHPKPGDMAMAYGQQLATMMEQSGFRDGCPIGTLMLETAPMSRKLTAVGREAFAAWSAVLAQTLLGSGVTQKRASELADFAIGAFEGALILSRVRQSAEPILRTAEEVRALFSASVK